MSWFQRVFLMMVVLVLGYGLWARRAASDLEVALAELLDGDADHRERMACLVVVRDQGLQRAGAGDVRAGLLAAMAAVDLGDEAGYRRATQLVNGKTPYLPGGGATAAAGLREASLGEPYLYSLMLAHAAENRDDRVAARPRFRRAMLSADLFGAELAKSLAAAGLSRTR